jgi:glutathione S-transferase
MADITIHILKPSVNNLTARIFVRAAGLDFEEVDSWGVTTSSEFLKMNPAHLTPTIEEAGLPKGALWESCAIMQYLCNKHGLKRFYPADPAERAMIDSAMCYLLATVYPLLARATYPALSFPQYPGEVGSSDADPEAKAGAQRAAEAALAEPLEVFHTFFMDGKTFIGGSAFDRGHAPGGVARVPEGDRLRLARVAHRVHGRDGAVARNAYTEPAGDVRGYIAHVKSQVA